MDAAMEQNMYWRLAKIRVLLYSAMILGSSWLSMTATVNWDTISFPQKINLFIGVLVAWSTVMVAFLDRTMSRILAGKMPIGEGQTDILRIPDKKI